MIPQGTTITFATSGFAADLLTLSLEMGRESYEATSYEDIAAVMGVADLGRAVLSIGFAFDPNSEPPIDQAAEKIRIEWPKTSGQSRGTVWSFDGFVSEYDPGASMESRMESSMQVVVSGSVTTIPGRRIFRIAPVGQASYENSSEEDHQKYGWLADSGTGLMPNGDDPYVIAESV